VLRQKKFGDLQVTKITEAGWLENQKKTKYSERREKAAVQRKALAKD